MADEILEGIQKLAHEEHELRAKASEGRLTDEEKDRLHYLEVRLDQCWDLLRQRRARAGAGLDPDDAALRPADTVENYRQ